MWPDRHTGENEGIRCGQDPNPEPPAYEARCYPLHVVLTDIHDVCHPVCFKWLGVWRRGKSHVSTIIRTSDRPFSTWAFFPRDKAPLCMKLNTDLHLIWRLRMGIDLLLISHVPSCHVQGNLYLHILRDLERS